MREIFLSIVVMVAIAFAAAFSLEALNWSAEKKFSSEQGNVRVR